MDKKPNFCHCGERLVESQEFIGHDSYTGEPRYKSILKCPKRGKLFAGQHDRYDRFDNKWWKYDDFQV